MLRFTRSSTRVLCLRSTAQSSWWPTSSLSAAGAVNSSRSASQASRASLRARALRSNVSAQAQQASEQAAELDLPTATHSRVKSASFVKSSTKLDQCPKPVLPEFAVIGRSNVGKSSLINMLTSKHGLAMVSKTPGMPSTSLAVAPDAAADLSDRARPVVQARPAASTTFSSTTAGTWSTCPAMGEPSSQPPNKLNHAR